jgi:hypothetical protein
MLCQRGAIVKTVMDSDGVILVAETRQENGHADSTPQPMIYDGDKMGQVTRR